ncbi:MAG: energy transducer TonB [Chloroflexota bacterium]
MATNQATVVALEQRVSGYGAVEIKSIIKKNTYRGFIITTSIFVLLFLLYFVIDRYSESRALGKKLAPITKIKIEDLQQEDEASQEEILAPPPAEMVNTGPAARAGTPVPVPDAQITADMQDFATIDVQSRASAEGGNGLDMGGFSSNIDFTEKPADVKIETREQLPEPDEFIPVEKEPAVDLGKLQAKIVYPDLARRAGVEGQVVLRVLVGANGKVLRSLIESSDNELLNEAAIKAIKEYGSIPPAIQNGQPITCWVSIPIKFRLR